MRFTAQEVAAAILCLHGDRMQYERLTKQVLATKLSGLGSRYGHTPERTMNTELNKRYRKTRIFDGKYVARYGLENPEQIREFPHIAQAIEQVRKQRLSNRIQTIRNLLDGIAEDNCSRYDVAACEKYNDELEKILHEILITIKEGMGERPTPDDKKAFKYRHTRH